MTPTLKTPRLNLRPLAMGDAEAMFAMLSDTETMRFWDWPAFKDRAVVEDVVAAQIRDVDACAAMYWAVCLMPAGEMIGSCDLSDIDRHHGRAEVGFLFNRAWWGNGFAREAMEAVVNFATTELGIARLWARFHTGNAASQRLLERLGFSREGTLRGHIIREGRRRDCEIYARMR